MFLLNNTHLSCNFYCSKDILFIACVIFYYSHIFLCVVKQFFYSNLSIAIRFIPNKKWGITKESKEPSAAVFSPPLTIKQNLDGIAHFGPVEVLLCLPPPQKLPGMC